MAELHVLSGNRDLEKQIEEADKMLTQIDVERLPAYRRVVALWEQRVLSAQTLDEVFS